MLCTDLKTQHKCVAKKIILDALNEKERAGAVQEAEVLKKLAHPNIVQYIESFMESGILCIIMEYCEVGDLSLHIKKMKQKDERFSEVEILN